MGAWGHPSGTCATPNGAASKTSPPSTTARRSRPGATLRHPYRRARSGRRDLQGLLALIERPRLGAHLHPDPREAREVEPRRLDFDSTSGLRGAQLGVWSRSPSTPPSRAAAHIDDDRRRRRWRRPRRPTPRLRRRLRARVGRDASLQATTPDRSPGAVTCRRRSLRPLSNVRAQAPPDGASGITSVVVRPATLSRRRPPSRRARRFREATRAERRGRRLAWALRHRERGRCSSMPRGGPAPGAQSASLVPCRPRGPF